MVEEYNGSKSQKLQLGEGTVILDFYATWCGPCKKLAPIFMSIAEEATKSNASATFFKIDVDKFQDLTAKYEIDSMPTVLVLKNGKVQDRVEGFDERKIRQTVASRI